jgi:DNA-binding NarL/FixJ family response regulator
MSKILIADDHELVRNGLRSLLQSVAGVTVVAESRDGNEAVAQVESLHPDIAVLDVAMPKLNGIDAAKQIRKRFSATNVIMLSMHADEEYVAAALRAGVRGYVLKQEAFAQLLSAITAVKAGGVFISTSISEEGLADYF